MTEAVIIIAIWTWLGLIIGGIIGLSVAENRDTRQINRRLNRRLLNNRNQIRGSR